MKKLVLLILFSVSLLPAFADHLKGGFFSYEYLSHDSVNNTTKYHVTLTVYMNCNSETNSAQVNPTINFTFFNSATNTIYKNVPVNISSKYRLQKGYDEPCITGNQMTCFYYIVIYDLITIDLPDNAAGYTVSYQRCCRIIDIKNMPSNPASSTVGNTYSIHIPGTSTPNNGHHNSSATFLVNDTAVVCGGSFFEAPFDAMDPDGDALTYSFCDAWTGGGTGGSGNGPNSATPDPAAAPLTSNPVTYPVIPYANGFSGGAPLGLNVTIDANTGKISGIAPKTPGEYVVTVCVTELRQGVAIASSRKELHLTVGQCSPIQATLDPAYITCDGYTVNFFNQTNSGVQTFFWDFGAPTLPNNTSTSATPTFTYADTGTYNVKLVVNRNSLCPDSTTTVAKVYPGFFPGFTVQGVCINKPSRFFDSTVTAFGVVNSWSWNFGDVNAINDTSHLKNPQYTFTQLGPKTVNFIVTNSKGCIDTVTKVVDIIDKPVLKVLPKDTLICNGDQVQLQAIGGGVFSWMPGTNINDPNSASPIVSPKSTTSYVVLLDDNGCLNRDTARVRVVDFVTLRARNDTVICATDSVQLTGVTDGLRFQWTGPGIQDPTRLTTMALPTGTSSTYQLKSIIGSCSTDGSFTANLVPYPKANAGPDVEICFDTKTQLSGQIVASSFAWSPAATLTNPSTLNPIAYPRNTTTYVLTVYDTLGCPKPFRDSVIVKVRPKMQPFAGKDTAVVVNQPLQFHATGGTQYVWTPGTNLNKSNVPDPIGLYTGNFDSITYKVVITDAAGCKDSTRVSVRVFRTEAQVFVPTAFTPNGDGHNDFFRPIPVGIARFEYFRVYNRWGELVYNSVSGETGWDGRLNGREQATGTYVWLLKGEDFGGRPIMQKGHVTLIR